MKFTTFLALPLSSSMLHALESSRSIRRRAAEEETKMMMTMNNMVKIRVTNEAHQQPFGPFFVMTHNKMETPLFKVGYNATKELTFLAENGDFSMLVNMHSMSENVGYLGAVNEGVPFFGGETLEFMVPYNMDYPYPPLLAWQSIPMIVLWR